MKNIYSIFRFICLITLSGVNSLAEDDHKPEVKILQPGVKLTLIAEQPDIVTPTGLDVDEQASRIAMRVIIKVILFM